MNDLRFAFRQLIKSPGFTLAAVLTLAIGIGANTAVFTFINAILLRPLPFPESHQLVQVFESYAPNGSHKVMPAPPVFEEWRKQTKALEGLWAGNNHGFLLTGQGEPAGLTGSELSANAFNLLGVRPLLGRGFSKEEETYGNHHVVLLSYELWQRRFGGDAALVGREVLLNSERYTVVGVMPPRTFFPEHNSQVWTPLAFAPDERNNRHSHNYNVYGRLKPHVSLAQAQIEMELIAKRIAQSDPQNKDWSAEVYSLQEVVVGNSRLLLLALLASVGMVLLIGCANIANLMLARAAARTREFAIRAALGAGSGQMIRQLLTESLLVAVLGGGGGILLAALGLETLVRLSPPELPRIWETISIDGRVLSFSLLITLVTGIAFGLAPALHLSDRTLGHALNEGSRGSTMGHRQERFRRSLVISEVALSLMLLTTAGLMIRSFNRLLSQPLGYRPAEIVSFDIGLTDQNYPDQAARAKFFEELLNRVKAVPELRSAALAAGLPLAHWDAHVGVEVEGVPTQNSQDHKNADYAQISPGYFSTLSIPLLSGRDFTVWDRASSTPVVIVNASFTKDFRLGDQVLGRYLNLSDGTKHAEIIGVVQDTKRSELADATRGEMYLPFQQKCWGQMRLVVRTHQDLAVVERTVRDLLAIMDKDVPILGAHTMTQLLEASVSQRRMSMLLLSVFAGVAMLLAAIGLYGVMAYHVAQRSQEIGIRRALGAQNLSVFGMVLRQGIALATIGITIGAAGAVALAHVLRGLLYEIKPIDPLTFVTTAILLLAVVSIACWIPARRATRINPLEALRHE